MVTRVGGGVVIRPGLDRAARPFESLTDTEFEQAWEQPMRESIAAMQDAYRSGAKRIVLVIPTLAMSGGANYAHVAAPAEALRVLVKSAARQWGADGVTVNAVALAPESFVDDPTGPTSIAAPALSSSGGADVVIAARRAATGEPVADAIRAEGGSSVCIETDVTDREAVAACVSATVDRFGGLDVMVHNAFAGAIPHRLDEADLDRHWSLMSRTGMWATLYCGQAAWPHLRAAGERGRFIIVTSPSGIEGSANIALYSAVKAAQRAVAKSLASEWGPSGVTVNCIAPVAASPALVTAFERNPALREAIEARTPLGRVGDITDDIGAVAAFLASDDSRYVSGQTIVCDGGSFTGL
jgi:3-oxoacyl-[acyl-carrier protein] reductase